MKRYLIYNKAGEFVVYAESKEAAIVKFDRPIGWIAENPIDDSYYDMNKCGLIDFGCGE